MNETFWSLLTESTETLAERWGTTSKAEVRRRRLAVTGQSRTLAERWQGAFGCWGGVCSIDEIARRVGLEKQVVRDHMKGMSLRAATRSYKRTHAELAVLLYADHERPARESCQTYGVLRSERTLLCGYAQTLLDQHAVRFVDLLDWTPAALEEAWHAAGFSMEPPVARVTSSASRSPTHGAATFGVHG